MLPVILYLNVNLLTYLIFNKLTNHRPGPKPIEYPEITTNVLTNESHAHRDVIVTSLLHKHINIDNTVLT